MTRGRDNRQKDIARLVRDKKDRYPFKMKAGKRAPGKKKRHGG